MVLKNNLAVPVAVNVFCLQERWGSAEHALARPHHFVGLSDLFKYILRGIEVCFRTAAENRDEDVGRIDISIGNNPQNVASQNRVRNSLGLRFVEWKTFRTHS